MKQKLRPASALRFCLAILLGALLWMTAPAPLWAVTDAPVAPTTLASGEQLFEIHCAGCHPGGGNIIRRSQSLKAKALKRNHMDTPDAIATLIAQGKNNMSAFGDRLSPAEIAQLTTYVLEQSVNGWS